MLNIEKNIFEVSIILSPDYRKHRISQKLLFGAISKFYKNNKEVKLLAKIHKDNISSIKIFKKLGFTITENYKLIKDFDSYVLEFNKLVNSKAVSVDNTNNNQKTVGIMQPTFLPWLGYFALMKQVDYFVLLDDVQVAKRSWQVRNRIKTKANVPIWLTLPVKKHAQQTMLNDVEISKDNNGRKLTKNLLTSFKQNYSKTEFFEEAYDLIYKNINRDKLVDITSEIIIDAKFCMGISTPVYKSSDLDVDVKNREQRLINIINFFGCKNYISPIGSSKYLELESSKKLFSQNAIDIKYLHFEHPEYKQFGDSFLEQMAIVDCIANEGYFAINNILELGIFEPTFRPKL